MMLIIATIADFVSNDNLKQGVDQVFFLWLVRDN